jgi:phosphotransferase system IIB component
MADRIRHDVEAACAKLDKITTKTQQLRLELKQERQANLDLLKQIDEMSSHQ